MPYQTPHKTKAVFRIMNGILSSNTNRLKILHLLKNCKSNECQVEEIARSVGIAHRTVVYHLDILQGCGLVEVRKVTNRGGKEYRSVWGLTANENTITFLKEVFCRNNMEALPCNYVKMTRSKYSRKKAIV